ncbi:energy transducer TonB [Thiohalomonas denitrificans]|uniref:energy transducer TonB n=1 Tax=Thiohalomonas denitrificans TaxID=415747 RepID=UPI0026F20C8D|nr:energy transducer TonB [Thiohalomonas denitrificans]
MYRFSRILLSLLGGVATAASLFWMMQQLLTSEAAFSQEERQRPVMEFVRLKRNTEVRLKERETPQPEPPQEETPPDIPEVEIDIAQPLAKAPDIDFKAPDLSMAMANPYIGPVRTGPPDREVMAVSRVPPRYPYRAERSGIEGWVKVSFLVTEQGGVQDAVVVESEPEQTFDQAAIRAVLKWKFKPRIENGEPVAVRVQQVVNFRLDGRRR